MPSGKRFQCRNFKSSFINRYIIRFVDGTINFKIYAQKWELKSGFRNNSVGCSPSNRGFGGPTFHPLDGSVVREVLDHAFE